MQICPYTLMEGKTSFRQFEFCKLCRISHKKRKKHVYSKHHQEILGNILKKFTLKISAAKKMLFAPVAKEPDFEVGAKFWCYFCEEEYDKHKVIEMTTLLAAGLLEHIASSRHNENLTQFFWDNLVTDKKLKTGYLISDGDLLIFKKASFLAVKKFQKAKDMDRKKVAATITFSEFQRQNFSQSEVEKPQIIATDVRNLPGNSRNCEQTLLDNNGQTLLWKRGHAEKEERIAGKKTVSAFAEGLTCVNIKGDETEGNIFTGATPPWLQKDTAQDTRDCIGPTIEDYQKHLEAERKSKLPAVRVGAKFDHTAESSQSWLPSFGRVWSKGRRLQSKIHFEKEMKSISKRQNLPSYHKKNDLPAASSTPGTSEAGVNQLDTNYGMTSASQTHMNQDTVIHHNGGPVHNFENDTFQGSSSKLYSYIVPYKRKVKGETLNDNTAPHWSISEALSANHSSFHTSANQIVPYKRKRTEAVSSTTLIQTPLLYDEKFKPNK